jgi:hypothetical protein
MRRYWILASLGALLIVVALAIGLTPVHSDLLFFANENGPGGDPSISCGSPLVKHPPIYGAPFEGLRLEGNDPCSLARDHRRLPVKIAGGAGLVLLAAASVDALSARRRRRERDRPASLPIPRKRSGPMSSSL